ncbi:hypothetical protein BBJ28_00023448 [Nothophytophthora sp. Chile5]|nr:hypothetical protein BBJ28_00023448 [Nothophytophthora sp. Chile5]
MDETAEEQEAARASAAASRRQQQQQQEEEEEEEEMPLLFMEGLPSNFQQNAQLAALATFMAASDDEDDEHGADPQRLAAQGRRESDGRSGRQRRLERSRRRRQPYAKPADREEEGRTKKEKEGDTKELQLFLSLFHV